MNDPYIADLGVIAQILHMDHLASAREQVERLFRRGKIKAVKRGRAWMTTRRWIDEGLARQSRRRYA